MRAAFHFNAAIYARGSELSWCAPFFQTLLAHVPSTRRHVRLHAGDLLIGRYAPSRSELARSVLTESSRVKWCRCLSGAAQAASAAGIS